MVQVLPEAWETWYRFAVEKLELEHSEAVEYANARYVEDQNHARLRGGEPASRGRPDDELRGPSLR
jgi:hypothetical protein